MKERTYTFKSKVWKYSGPAGWFFITLPKSTSVTIRKKHGQSEEGWGRLKAVATIGKTCWSTAIWFDTKADAYLLPVKSEVRKKEKIKENSSVAVRLEIDEFKIRSFGAAGRT